MYLEGKKKKKQNQKTTGNSGINASKKISFHGVKFVKPPNFKGWNPEEFIGERKNYTLKGKVWSESLEEHGSSHQKGRVYISV